MRVRVAHRVAKSHLILRVIDREFEHPERHPIALGNPLGQRQRLRLELFARDHDIDEAEPAGLFGANEPALKQDLLRLADRQIPRNRKVLEQRGQELRVLRRDDQVHRRREHPSAKDTVALNHRDCRFVQVAPAHRVIQEQLSRARIYRAQSFAIRTARSIFFFLRRSEIVAGAKMFALAGEHDHADLVVVVGIGERRVHLFEQNARLGVTPLGPGKDHARDPSVLFIFDMLVRHRRYSFADAGVAESSMRLT